MMEVWFKLEEEEPIPIEVGGVRIAHLKMAVSKALSVFDLHCFQALSVLTPDSTIPEGSSQQNPILVTMDKTRALSCPSAKKAKAMFSTETMVPPVSAEPPTATDPVLVSSYGWPEELRFKRIFKKQTALPRQL